MTSRILLRVANAARLYSRPRINAVPRSVSRAWNGTLRQQPESYYKRFDRTISVTHASAPHQNYHLTLSAFDKRFKPDHDTQLVDVNAVVPPQTSIMSALGKKHYQPNGGLPQNRKASSVTFCTPSREPRRRTYVGRRSGNIEKRKSFSLRGFANSAKTQAPPVTDKSGKSRVTWRDALKSPRKAGQYSLQLWRGLINWCKHMWAGVKLLAADVRVSSKVLKKITHGKQISRRERNFIVKTGVDLARLVPFSLFLIVPLAEFALPFALRLFPNMLPSQFQDQIQAEENLKRRLKGRLELAKYLRDVVEEKARTIKASDANSVSREIQNFPPLLCLLPPSI